MHEIGRVLFFAGLALALIWKTGGLGRLPGDLFIQKGNSSFAFPMVTCLLISAGLSGVMWLFRR